MTCIYCNLEIPPGMTCGMRRTKKGVEFFHAYDCLAEKLNHKVVEIHSNLKPETNA